MIKFKLGQVVITRGALNELSQEDISNALTRHVGGDWGEICKEDKAENELAIKEGFRIFSVYKTTQNVKFWVITEADRSVTTLLLPEDY